MRLEDILASIEKISRYTNDLNYTAFAASDVTADAVIRHLSLIGEAASHVPEEIIARYPTVPWREMRAIRNILVHEYFGVDTKTIWETINQDLPPSHLTASASSKRKPRGAMSC